MITDKCDLDIAVDWRDGWLGHIDNQPHPPPHDEQYAARLRACTIHDLDDVSTIIHVLIRHHRRRFDV
jgi:hypothetical protein